MDHFSENLDLSFATRFIAVQNWAISQVQLRSWIACHSWLVSYVQRFPKRDSNQTLMWKPQVSHE